MARLRTPSWCSNGRMNPRTPCSETAVGASRVGDMETEATRAGSDLVELGDDAAHPRRDEMVHDQVGVFHVAVVARIDDDTDVGELARPPAVEAEERGRARARRTRGGQPFQDVRRIA